MSKVERFPCWSCGESVSMRQRADEDGDCPHCGVELDLEDWPAKPEASTHPLIKCLNDNGDLIALRATVAQQAQMIEHLRGGPTPLYTAVDMANAARDGFRDGAASVVVDLSKHHGGQHLPGTERMFLSDVIAAIEAAGGSAKP